MSTNKSLLNKFIKKTNKDISNENSYGITLLTIKDLLSTSTDRELSFLLSYYGIECKAETLEQIGDRQDPKLTRERVRQIIENVVNKIPKDFYIKIQDNFKKSIGSDSCIDFTQLTKSKEFDGFNKNSKGLAAILNDCEIKQVAYRKKIYFYSKEILRGTVIKHIQKMNKEERRKKTLNNMNKKAKTVTYVPTDVKTWLKSEAKKHKTNLNPFYEKIINEYISVKPYLYEDYEFAKTKSWKARKGKAEWSQVGIYIDRDLFNKMKEEIVEISKITKKYVSLMGFISQAFVWYRTDRSL